MTGDTKTDEMGTTSTDYRWKYLSTVWALLYGLGLPAWLLMGAPDVPDYVLAAMILAWGGTVVYVIGIKRIRQWAKVAFGGGD